MYKAARLLPLKHSPFNSSWSGLLKRWFGETVVLSPAENTVTRDLDEYGENEELAFHTQKKQGFWSSEPRKQGLGTV